MIRNKSERGQSLVELALSMVILMYLLAGAVELGIALFQYIQLRDAAQDGALYGSLNPTETANIKSRVWGAASSPIADPLNTIAITISVPNNCVVGDNIIVTATYEHKIFMPFATVFMPPTRTISASSTNVILKACN